MTKRLSDKEVGDLLLKLMHRLPHFRIGVGFKVGTLGEFVPTNGARNEVRRIIRILKNNPDAKIIVKKRFISLQLIKRIAKLHNYFKPSNTLIMSTKIPESRSFESEKLDNGSYPAICVGVALLGTRPKVWKGKTSYAKMIRIFWETPEEKYTIEKKDGTEIEISHVISQTFTFSSSTRGNLFKVLNAWSGGKINNENIVNFDIVKIVGNAGAISVEQVVKEENTYVNFKGILPLMKGITAPEPTREPFVFDIENFDKETFLKLPRFVRAEIAESQEFEEQGLKIEDFEEETDESSNAKKDNKPTRGTEDEEWG